MILTYNHYFLFPITVNIIIIIIKNFIITILIIKNLFIIVVIAMIIIMIVIIMITIIPKYYQYLRYFMFISDFINLCFFF